MSVAEKKQRLTELISGDNEALLNHLLEAAEDFQPEELSREYESPEFFREMDEDCEAVASGKERDFSHEEAMDILRNRKHIL